MAAYQASYGVSEPDSDVATVAQSTSAETTAGDKDTPGSGVKKDSSEVGHSRDLLIKVNQQSPQWGRDMK